MINISPCVHFWVAAVLKNHLWVHGSSQFWSGKRCRCVPYRSNSPCLKQPLWAETASQLRRAKNISCSIHGFETPSKVVIKSHELPFDLDTVSIQSNIATTGKEYCRHDCFWVHRAVAHLNSRTVCGKPDRLLAKSGEETVQPCTWPLVCFSALSLCSLVTQWILK